MERLDRARLFVLTKNAEDGTIDYLLVGGTPIKPEISYRKTVRLATLFPTVSCAEEFKDRLEEGHEIREIFMRVVKKRVKIK